MIENVQSPLRFHDLLYEHIRPHLLEWATGPSAFVVVCLMEAPGFSHHDEVLELLRGQRARLEQAALEKPTRAVEPVESNGQKGHKRRKTTAKPEPAGNQGAAVLLKMLDRTHSVAA